MRKRWLGGLAIVVGAVVLLLLARILAPGGGPAAGGGEVGVVSIGGAILDGRGGDRFFGSPVAGSQTIAEQLQEARQDPQIRAVVLRINSPGGSAAASQEIATAVERLRAGGKPVVASLGDTAASGAYWIASQADRVVAAPATLTGSIGVIMQVQNMRGLYDKLGISVEVIKSGAHKDAGAGLRDLSQEERRRFQDMVDDIYEQFVQVVASGRGMSREKVLALADGSVYTGRQALRQGLVDELGDYETALSRARDLAGLAPEAPVRSLGKPSPWEWLWSGSLWGRTRSLSLNLQPGLWLLAPTLVPAGGDISD